MECVCVPLFLMHKHSFEQSARNVASLTLWMVMGVSECRSSTLARALRAVCMPLQISGRSWTSD